MATLDNTTPQADDTLPQFSLFALTSAVSGAIKGQPITQVLHPAQEQYAMDISSLSSIVTAVGALGTSSSGLVDATKFFNGGISVAGLGDIEKALLPLFGGTATDRGDTSSVTSYGSVFANIKATWINGVALEEQKANARTLVKLSLNANTAATLAKGTGVSSEVLTELAVALHLGAVLTKEEMDVLNKFEEALGMIVDQASSVPTSGTGTPPNFSPEFFPSLLRSLAEASSRAARFTLDLSRALLPITSTQEISGWP